MDPNANLAQQIAIARRIERAIDRGLAPDGYDVARLAELVLALDDWIRGGGALPAEWEEARRR